LLETLLNTGEAERERCFSSLPQLSLNPPSTEIKSMYARFRRWERSGRDFIYLSLLGTVVFKGVSDKRGGDEPFFATINRMSYPGKS